MLGAIDIKLIHGGFVLRCSDRSSLILKDLPEVLKYTERYFKEKERENNPDEKAKDEEAEE